MTLDLGSAALADAAVAYAGQGLAVLLLPDTLDGDERALDRGDAHGSVCHADDQAQPDQPVTGFVSFSRRYRAHLTPGGRCVPHNR